MAQSIEEQMNMVERALGERMINHALVVARSWMNELGVDAETEAVYGAIFEEYDALFDGWLVMAGTDQDTRLDNLTSRSYRLLDDLYIRMRLKRGLSPQMQAFNGDNPQSVMHYFSSCVQLTQRDIDWFHAVIDDSSRSSLALMAIASLAKNLREIFSITALQLLIDGVEPVNHMVGEQSLANLLVIFAHYDVRIDFFPDLQDAFIEAIGDGERAFEIFCALIRSAETSLRDLMARNELSYDELPDELKDLLSATGTHDISGISAWMPATEKEYMSGIIQMLPETWIYSVLVGEDVERQRTVKLVYLGTGRMDLMWDDIEMAERWLVHRLRGDKATTMDYINYGHCLLLKGDRMMAFENYRTARMMCKNAKTFLNLFRPDRHMLVEKGVPIEQVYLIEDQLLK